MYILNLHLITLFCEEIHMVSQSVNPLALIEQYGAY